MMSIAPTVAVNLEWWTLEKKKRISTINTNISLLFVKHYNNNNSNDDNNKLGACCSHMVTVALQNRWNS